MRLYKYKDYEDYKRVQILTNKRKLTKTWVRRESLDLIAEKLKEKIFGDIKFGLCHGTRRGLEQQVLGELLGCEVLGTEISPTAAKFPNTIEWDFHDVKDSWLGNVDFIYSNSLDHSYDPMMCVKQWMKCLRDGGYCVLHWSKGHNISIKADPFGASLGEYVDIAYRVGLEEVVRENSRLYLIFIRK
jgi:hypothetical protein